ncbi:UPF0426 protein At1g28150, chloroplastic [Asparagus officinalis]|nr:UPF0426 protein At1g28150, chloroplastic [Asparagus officinalis]XP_020248279.1 UPF0426 protein At1g28150, chloroplastic [Asparagus officinalis]XP_020248280.1 UPF0426 protein At1g28150, chloroplastic [Asparagus officinalis]
MALLYSSPSMLVSKRFPPPVSPSTCKRSSRTNSSIKAFFNPFEDQPILKDAIKEPVAFMGGVFAGLLRLDLNEDPLREWITKTVEASGLSAEELERTQESGIGEEEDEGPQQIEIE